MIVYITTWGHGRPMRSLSRGKFGFPAPPLRITSYERLLRTRRVPRATYIFADLERLAPWELKWAAELFRVLTQAGLRCLNDPARAMSRVELLRSLKSAGINPFDVLRADEQPRPARFPVFLRFEQDHDKPVSDLIANQDALDEALRNLRLTGVPLRGVIVIEHYPAPYSDGLWHKWGTFRVGRTMSVDHIAVDDGWCVKYGVWEKLTDRAIADEHEAVKTNRFAESLAPAFDLAGIDFGRADHATVKDRNVIYEINTNPFIGPYVPDPKPLRRETQELARRRFAEALEAIDTADTGLMQVPDTEFRRLQRRSWWFGWLGPRRP
jgi:hypothetical protein